MADLTFEVTKWQTGVIETNLDDVEKAVSDSLQKYKGLVVQEDQISEAKKTKSEMNALAKNINSWRLQKEREFMAPFQVKKDQCNRIVSMIKETSSEIDDQLKAFDQREKEAKKTQIEAWWKEHRPGGMDITLDQVWDERYLNKTGLGQAWMLDLERKAGEISKDLDAITNIIMSDTAEGNYVAEEYHRTLDLGGAINHWAQHVEEQKRLEQLRADAEARKAQMEVERQTDQKAHEKPQDAQVANGGQSTIRHESGPNSPVETGTNGAESDSVMYWAEFRVQNATLEQMKQLTAAFQQIGIEFHLLRYPDGSPRKGNSGK